MATIYVGHQKLRVTPHLSPSNFKLVRDKFTYTVKDYQFTTQHKEYGWNGRRTLFFKDQSAPAGCLYRMVQVLEDHCGIDDIEIIHENDYYPKGKIEVHGFSLKDFQERAVKRVIRYRRGIIEAPVRAGKTAIAAAIINKIGHKPVWVITFGKDLVHQTRKDLEYHLQIPVGVFSEGKYTPGDVVVTSYQAINRAITKNKPKRSLPSQSTQERNYKILESLNETRVVIFDECHHAYSPKNKKVFAELKSAGYIIGLSGTPKPDNMNKLEVEAALGSVIFRVKYETLIKHGRLARPMIILYKLPYRWYTTALKEFAEVYEANIVENMHRNLFIADIVKNLRKSGKSTFVMIRKLAHGPILRALIPGSVFVHGTIPSDQRAALYDGLHNKKIWCVVSTVGKEGLNIPKLDAVVNAEGLESSVVTLQKMRSLTAAEGKTRGLVIDFLDRGKFLTKHSKARLKLYRRVAKKEDIKTKQVPSNHYKMEGSRWEV